VNQAAVLLWRCSTTQVLQHREDHARNAAGMPGSAEFLLGKLDIGGCSRVSPLCCDPVLAGGSKDDPQRNVLTILVLNYRFSSYKFC